MLSTTTGRSTKKAMHRSIQPTACWIHCHLRWPVRLRVAVQRDEACNLIVPRIGFLRTRTQRSGTQSAAADGTRTRWLFELRRCRSLIEAVCGNLRTNEPNCYIRSLRARARALISIPLRNVAAVQAERLKIDQGLVASHMLVHQNRGRTRPVKSMPKMPSSDIAIGVRVQRS